MTLVLFDAWWSASRGCPAVSFELLSLADDPYELLRRDEIDFLILPETFMSSTHPRTTCSRSDSCASDAAPTTCYHATLRSKPTCRWEWSGQVRGIEECYLIDHGLKRRVKVVVQSFSMVPPTTTTDRIGTIPSMLAKHFAKAMPLRIVEANASHCKPST